MSKRALFLAIVAVVAAVVVVALLKPRPAAGGPLKPDAHIKLTRPDGQCKKTSTELEGFLRGSRNEQTQFTWHIANGCEAEATVCVTDFTHESGEKISPFSNDRYCNEPNGPNANRINAAVSPNAR
jgi:hypothetical protein